MLRSFATAYASPCVCRMLMVFVCLWVRADTLAKKPGRDAHQSATSDKVDASSEHRSVEFSQLSKTGKEKNQSLLPELPDVESPGPAFQSLNTYLHKVHTQLHAMQQVDSAALAKQKTTYEHQLAMQQSEIANAESLNSQTTNATMEIRKVNLALRKKASQFAAANEKIRLELLAVQTNISYAMEFVWQALNATEILFNATEVNVVKEMNVQDSLMQQRWAHKMLVNSIGMLQLNSSKEIVPSLVLDGVMGSFDDYQKQKATRENSLKMMFEFRFRAAAQRLQLLQDEGKKLHAFLEGEKQLQGRLVVAVQHLERTHERLLHWKQSLLNHFQNLGEQHQQSRVAVH